MPLLQQPAVLPSHAAGTLPDPSSSAPLPAPPLTSYATGQVSATWQEEAEQKRLEALRRCVEAPAVPLSEEELARIEEAKAKPAARGRGGAPEAMDADGGGAAAAARGGKKGGGKRGKKGVAVGGRKKKKQVGVLSSMSGERDAARALVAWRAAG